VLLLLRLLFQQVVACLFVLPVAMVVMVWQCARTVVCIEEAMATTVPTQLVMLWQLYWTAKQCVQFNQHAASFAGMIYGDQVHACSAGPGAGSRPRKPEGIRTSESGAWGFSGQSMDFTGQLANT
jgi:hypothetical protein